MKEAQRHVGCWIYGFSRYIMLFHLQAHKSEYTSSGVDDLLENIVKKRPIGNTWIQMRKKDNNSIIKILKGCHPKSALIGQL